MGNVGCGQFITLCLCCSFLLREPVLHRLLQHESFPWAAARELPQSGSLPQGAILQDPVTSVCAEMLLSYTPFSLPWLLLRSNFLPLLNTLSQRHYQHCRWTWSSWILEPVGIGSSWMGGKLPEASHRSQPCSPLAAKSQPCKPNRLALSFTGLPV